MHGYTTGQTQTNSHPLINVRGQLDESFLSISYFFWNIILHRLRKSLRFNMSIPKLPGFILLVSIPAPLVFLLPAGLSNTESVTAITESLMVEGVLLQEPKVNGTYLVQMAIYKVSSQILKEFLNRKCKISEPCHKKTCIMVYANNKDADPAVWSASLLFAPR